MVIKRKIFVKMDAKELVGSTFRFCMVVMVTFNVVNKVRIVRVWLIVIVGQFCYVRINVFTFGVEDYELVLITFTAMRLALNHLESLDSSVLTNDQRWAPASAKAK
jgi:hypothetical protein